MIADMKQTRKQLRKRRNTQTTVLSFTSFMLGFIATMHPELPYPLVSSLALASLSVILGIFGISLSQQFQGFATIGILLSVIYLFAVVVTFIGR
jgi:hypothetical protein